MKNKKKLKIEWEIPRRTRFLYGLAFGVVVLSVYQWFIRYEDLSQLIFGLTTATFIASVGYMWEWINMRDKIDTNQSKRLDEHQLKINNLEEKK